MDTTHERGERAPVTAGLSRAPSRAPSRQGRTRRSHRRPRRRPAGPFVLACLGFSLSTIAELLALWRDRGRGNADVRRVARRHADELRRKMEQLRGMIGALDHLVHACAGDGRPECPILDDLAGGHERPDDAGAPPSRPPPRDTDPAPP